MLTVRKTKIICTLGPSTDKDGVLRQLMLEGMNAARFNFSHGTHDEQKARLAKVKELREELHLPIATVLDTKGPEVRLCEIPEGKVMLEEGQTFTLYTDGRDGDKDGVGISYAALASDVQPGTKILIDDGLIEMEVQSVTNDKIVCTVLNNGTISSKKGVNVPDVDLSMPYISPKDYDDILFGIENGFDYIAASFVRSAQDVAEIREILKEHGGEDVRIIAKIENMSGVNHIDEIVEAADGIMVARGDMGVEIPIEEVPPIQKLLIKKTYSAGKIVITATQMLDSMIKNPRPTRAEATDVANAIYDGTSAIMLSGETAAGDYPVEALQTMVKIALRTENDIDYAKRFKKMDIDKNPNVTNAISHATCMMGIDLRAGAIVTVTRSGFTARMISRYRPGCPIVGCCMNHNVWRKMNLNWGVIPLLCEMPQDDASQLFADAVQKVEAEQIVKPGEVMLITAGMPLGKSGTTNSIRVHEAGKPFVTKL